MKKLLLSAAVVLGAIFSAQAQLPYTQNFETSMTTIPTGWTENSANHPGNPGWQFNDVFAGSEWNTYTPTHTYVAFVDDADYNTTVVNDYDTLYSSSFSCAASPNVFMSFDLNFNNYTGAEVGTIAVSTDGGHTWTTAANLPSGSGDVTWHNGDLVNLSALAGGHANVMVAFCWNNVGSVAYGYHGWGMALDNINVFIPGNYGVQVTSQNLPYLMQVGKSYNFSGASLNDSGTTITSMTMNYSVNGGPAVSQAISGISGFSGLTTYNWSMNTTPYVPAAAGNITVKYWANPLNGTHTNSNTDTLVAHFMVVDSIQAKQVMYEEFSCASCDPCLHAMPNIDSVANNTVAYANNIRYHWYFPGQDMINQETATLVNNRMSYYGQNGVPTSAIDGAIWYPGYGYLSSGTIQAAYKVGSPFKIEIASATFNTITKKFALNANITSYGNFPAGLKAQVYLTEDSVDFKTDQSTEDPITNFVFDGGTTPNYLYDYVLNFPNAVEEALPNAAGTGTSLTAFTSSSTQNVTVSWTQNHPWAAKYNTYHYDSSATQHLTIFIQDDAGNAAAGVPAKYVYQSAKVLVTDVTGMEEISTGVYFNMYPNPTNGITTLAFKLDKDQNVNVQVFNMLGQQVYSDNEGTVSSGNHTISIDGSALQNGVYFVRFTSDNATTTQKLIIQK